MSASGGRDPCRHAGKHTDVDGIPGWYGPVDESQVAAGLRGAELQCAAQRNSWMRWRRRSCRQGRWLRTPLYGRKDAAHEREAPHQDDALQGLDEAHSESQRCQRNLERHRPESGQVQVNESNTAIGAQQSHPLKTRATCVASPNQTCTWPLYLLDVR